LDPGGILRVWRQSSPDPEDPSLAWHSLRQTDQLDHLYERYRQRYPAEKQSLEVGPGRVSFFPGCALSAYTPDLAWAAFEHLQQSLPDIGWLDGCCYDPLDKLGLADRFATSSRKLYERISDLGVEEIITACSTCTYRLQTLLPEVRVVSIYEWMVAEHKISFSGCAGLAIHDACLDRSTQSLGRAVRTLLGITSPVMKHEGKRSLCCGAGGDVPFFNPSLARSMAERRLAEAEAGGARELVTYCTTCAVQLASHSNSLSIVHVLDLLLGLERDYRQIAERVSHLREQAGEVST
jgi:Fe-S oxidoreductase